MQRRCSHCHGEVKPGDVFCSESCSDSWVYDKYPNCGAQFEVNIRSTKDGYLPDLLHCDKLRKTLNEYMSDVDIPENVLARFKSMHWVFPGDGIFVEPGEHNGPMEGYFEKAPGILWKCKIECLAHRNCERITLESVSSNVGKTLALFVAHIDKYMKEIADA